MDERRLLRYRELTAGVLRMKDQAETSFWQIGASLNEVSALKLYAEAAISTFSDYLQKTVSISPPQAYKWMAVAKNFTVEKAAELGIERCHQFLRYIEATPEDDLPADIDALRLRVPQADGSVVEKPARHCTVDEMKAAVQLVATSGAPSWTPEVKAFHDRLSGSLRGLAKVGVSLQEGKPVWSISGLNQGEFCELARRLNELLNCDVKST